jgi:serine/threonine protein kinase
MSQRGRIPLIYAHSLTQLSLQANILLDSLRRARITDFGLSIAMSQVPLASTHDPYDTARWTAPELHDNDPNDASIGMYTEASDIYAMAITFWEVKHIGSHVGTHCL